jgi:hypothetical protein
MHKNVDIWEQFVSNINEVNYEIKRKINEKMPVTIQFENVYRIVCFPKH